MSFLVLEILARLAGVDRRLDRRIPGEIDTSFFCFRRHVERVCRRGNEHRSAVIDNRLDPLRRGLRSARNCQCPQLPRALPTRPKTDERSE